MRAIAAGLIFVGFTILYHKDKDNGTDAVCMTAFFVAAFLTLIGI